MMKYFCVITVVYFVAFATGQSKEPKDSEPPNKNGKNSEPPTPALLSSPKPLQSQPPSELSNSQSESTLPASISSDPSTTTPIPTKLTTPVELPTTKKYVIPQKSTHAGESKPRLVKISPTIRPSLAKKNTTNKPTFTTLGPLELLHKLASTNSPTLLQEPYNPCAPFKPPPMPDFRAPGRRISEIKCYEYIWQLKLRNDKAGQENECYEFRSRGISSYIVGGHYTFSGDYPNMGAIGWKAVVGTWKFMCGCTLISHKFVLTAAHCSSASERDTTIADVVPKIVRLGDKNIQDVINGTRDAKIIRIITHPMYKSPKQYFDIALMELQQVLKFTMDIQPACLWTKDSITKYGEEAQVTGWGVVESGSLTTSPELLAATVDIIDFAKCNRLLHLSCNRNWCGLKPDQLCAGKLGGGVDACQGDSGGPLQVQIPLPVLSQGTMHYVIGVTSFGVGCALPGLPGVYTKVSSFVDWIESIVWPGHETTPVQDDEPDLMRFERSIRPSKAFFTH